MAALLIEQEANSYQGSFVSTLLSLDRISSSKENLSFPLEHQLSCADNNFCVRLSDCPRNFINNVNINSNWCVRDDKLNNVEIEINEDLFGMDDVVFLDSFLFGEDLQETLETSFSSHPFKQDTIYVLLSLKPRFGAFKEDVKVDSLLTVDYCKKNPENGSISMGIFFRRELRPLHSLQHPYHKKRKNWMNLYVILLFVTPYKRSTVTAACVTQQFTFRSNSGNTKMPGPGRHSRVYVQKKKRKLDAMLCNDHSDVSLSSPPPTPSPKVRIKIENDVMIKTPVVASLVRRIHPNRGFAFQVWEEESDYVTFLLIGQDLDDTAIESYFVHPTRGTLCRAPDKPTFFREKEYYVPSIKRLLEDDQLIALPREGLCVDVLFYNAVTGFQIVEPQKYTYVDVYTTAPFAYFGNSVGASGEKSFGEYANGNTSRSGSSIYDANLQMSESELLDYFSEGIHTSRRDINERTVLHLSVLHGFFSIAELAIIKGCAVNAQDIFICTPLHYAVFFGDEKMVCMLLENDADPSLQDCNGDSALHLAIKWREYKIVDRILSSNPHLLTQFLGQIPDEILEEEGKKLLQTLQGKEIYWNLGAIPYLPPLEQALCIYSRFIPNLVQINHAGTHKLHINGTIPEIFPEPGTRQSIHRPPTDNETGRIKSFPQPPRIAHPPLEIPQPPSDQAKISSSYTKLPPPIRKKERIIAKSAPRGRTSQRDEDIPEKRNSIEGSSASTIEKASPTPKPKRGARSLSPRREKIESPGQGTKAAKEKKKKEKEENKAKKAQWKLKAHLGKKGKKEIKAIRKDNPVVVHAEKLDISSKIPPWKIKKVKDKPMIVITGPFDVEDETDFTFTRASGSSISTYPHMKDKPARNGDPICDSFRLHYYHNACAFVIADGCGWGNGPKEASNSAKDSFIRYLHTKMREFKTAKEIAQHLVTALAIAHHSILSSDSTVSSWSLGTTTLLGGVLVELEQKEEDSDSPWIFIHITIGDCKAFKLSTKDGKVFDVSGDRIVPRIDARDCGGRIGPYERNDPDLRNLDISVTPCEPGDIFMLVSDGVHDNLDPEHLGKSPKDCGLKNYKTWKEIEDPNLLLNTKKKMMTEKLAEVIGVGKGDISTHQITKSLTKYCMDTTAKARHWMEQNPEEKLEGDYSMYPGKMDHTTCLAFKVGKYSVETETREREIQNEAISTRLTAMVEK